MPSPNPREDAVNHIFPIISMLGFALAWYFSNIYTATAFLMGLTTAQVALLGYLFRRVQKTLLIMWALVMGLGTLTLLLNDKAFIQLKTTVVYSVLALALFIGDRLKKNLPRLLLDSFFDAPAAVWRQVSNAAALYFLTLALCNYLVARYLSEAAWVAIKTFAFPAASLVFTVLLIVYLYRYLRDEHKQDVGGAKD